MKEGHAGPVAFVTHVPVYPVLREPGRVSDPALPHSTLIMLLLPKRFLQV